MNPYIRTLIEGIAGKPVMIRPAFLTEGVTVSVKDKEVTSWGNFAADLKALATVDVPAEVDLAQVRRDELCKAYGFQGSDAGKPFAFSGGMAIIPIHGSLMNRLPYSFSFATGYNFIQSQLSAAMADPDVAQIVYDVNSNGGMVAGCPECAAAMFSANGSNGGKPSIAVVDSNCYSAAYYLASAADSIAITPSGGAGSIGVVRMHMDISKALADFGVAITFVHAGDHKVDGNMTEPLSEEVTSDWQAEIDAIYSTFVSDVATYRPGLTEQAVRDTQARVYSADKAKSIGLVDSVQTPSNALKSAIATQVDGEESMATENNKPVLTQADIDTAAANARTAERSRIAGITGHAEAAGRTALASHLANNTDMTVEQAAGVMAASPKDAPAATEQKDTTGSHFNNAMNNGKNPDVGTGQGGEGEGQMTRAQQILAAQSKASGRKLEVVAK